LVIAVPDAAATTSESIPKSRVLGTMSRYVTIEVLFVLTTDARVGA